MSFQHFVLNMSKPLQRHFSECDHFISGLAQCAELCWQLRGEAGKRQVPNARLALQHNLGLGGACIVGVYRLGFPSAHR